MTDKVIVNASPLICLSRSRHLNVLEKYADEIWVPELVADEIFRYGQGDITAQAIRNSNRIIIKPAQHIPTILQRRLGPGESSVLALGLAHPGSKVIIDDLAGRKYAENLRIPALGTLGLALAAKHRGAISEARPVIEDMVKAGLYLSEQVLRQALARVGE